MKEENVMKRICQWILAALLVFSISPKPVHAQITLADGNARSAFRDTSNLFFGGNTEYRVNLNTASGDPDLYINQINLTPGPSWDSNLTLYTPSTDPNPGAVNTFRYNATNGTSGVYNLGTAISGNTHWNFASAFRFGDVDPNVADGIYNTTLDIVGGADSSAMDTLASFDLTLQVIQKLDVDVTMTADPDTIGQGQGTTISMTVKNNITGADFISTSWYYSAFANANGDNLVPGNFVGNWFDQHIAPGDSRTDLHTNWKAAANQNGGDYFGNLGVIGGLYSGDFYLVNNNPQVKVSVIPAPSSALSLMMGVGLLAPVIIRRNRAARQSN